MKQPSDPPNQDPPPPPHPPPHSAFSHQAKTAIIVMISLASFFSPLSGQIYFPVMPTLVKSYHLSPALINLTITTYLILQGLAPSFMGTLSDTSGRRPAYILAFALYTLANIGLALQSSYPALLVLRCLQSAGSSGTVSFGYGVVADIATPAERGKYIGPMAAGVMVAPAVGPVIGGLLSRYLGWRSVFWFLVVVSGGYLAVYVLFVPETARMVVGDGARLPTEWWRLSVVQYWGKRRRRRPGGEETGQVEEGGGCGEGNGGGGRPHTGRIAFPNPLASFRILLEKDAAIIIFYVGIVMFANLALMTSTPSVFGELYGFNDLQIGLCFLPLGVGACLGAFLNGKLLDYTYRRAATRLNLLVDRKHAHDLLNFPIEQTRLLTFFPVMTLGILTFLPYGWVLQQRTHLAVPLVLQFLQGFSFIAALNTLNTLLVDLFPDRAATASAACNLVRCWLGAVGAAVIDYMLRGMGWGWCFTFIGLLMSVGIGGIWVESIWGMGWRQRREEKMRGREGREMDVQGEGNDRGQREGEKDESKDETKSEGVSVGLPGESSRSVTEA